MRTPRLGPLLAALVLLTAAQQLPAQARPGDAGQFSTSCEFSHANNDDPIVYPGRPGVAHRHHYAGNRSVDFRSTTASLEAASSNCDRVEDKSAYWVPAVYNNGVELPFTASHVYYRNNNVADKSSTVAFPQGLRMVAGTAAHPEPPPNARTAEWACESTPNVVSDDFPDSCPSGRLIATITFPSCWDGISLTTDDQSHMAYPWENRRHPRACPSSHPVVLPEVTEWFRWSVETPDLSGLTLASGTGDTLHADFWNVWTGDSQAQLVERCLLGGRNCGTVGR